VYKYRDSHAYDYKWFGIHTRFGEIGLVMDGNKSGRDLSSCEATLVRDLS
jgi:hypothetical protein